MRFPVSSGHGSLSPFTEPREEEILARYNLQRLIKMSSNENCYGASPDALAVMHHALQAPHRYPDIDGFSLRRACAGKSGVSPSQIIQGNGSSDLIQMIVRTFLQGDDVGLTAEETFPIYKTACMAMNRTCCTVPLTDDTYDLEKMAAAVTTDTRIIFIANPNNPTGTIVPQKRLLEFIEFLPSNVLVVVDEAYREYVDPPEHEGLLSYLPVYPNLVVLRTFSKVYGLAGLRIGVAYAAEEIIRDLDRIRLPYCVNSSGLAAAIAALNDEQHVSRCVALNREQRHILLEGLRAQGLQAVPSQANFVLIRVKDAAAFCESLLQKGFLVAPMSRFGLPNGVRITLGTPEENTALLQACSF